MTLFQNHNTYTKHYIYQNTRLLRFDFSLVETYYIYRSPPGTHRLVIDTKLLSHCLQNNSSTKHFITLRNMCIVPFLLYLQLISSCKTVCNLDRVKVCKTYKVLYIYIFKINLFLCYANYAEFPGFLNQHLNLKFHFLDILVSEPIKHPITQSL